MKRGRADERTAKCVAICLGNFFRITIDISQAAATSESPIADAGHIVTNGDGGQVAAAREGIVVNGSHFISNHQLFDGSRKTTVIMICCTIMEITFKN